MKNPTLLDGLALAKSVEIAMLLSVDDDKGWPNSLFELAGYSDQLRA